MTPIGFDYSMLESSTEVKKKNKDITINSVNNYFEYLSDKINTDLINSDEYKTLKSMVRTDLFSKYINRRLRYQYSINTRYHKYYKGDIIGVTFTNIGSNKYQTTLSIGYSPEARAVGVYLYGQPYNDIFNKLTLIRFPIDKISIITPFAETGMTAKLNQLKRILESACSDNELESVIDKTKDELKKFIEDFDLYLKKIGYEHC